MKPEDSSKPKKIRRKATDNKTLMTRREVINKAGIYALSAATMMILLKTKTKGATLSMGGPEKLTASPPPSSEQWKRTTRN